MIERVDDPEQVWADVGNVVGVAKAEKAVTGQAPVKRNRFIALDGTIKSVNRDLEAKARTLAGLKGYRTNLAACPDGTPVPPSS